MSTPTAQRAWTVEQADAYLPGLDRLLDSVERALQGDRCGDPRLVLGGALAILAEDGVVVRDLPRRLVDFPAPTPAGGTVLLCRIGDEPRVAWWHHPDDGFAGRRSLDTDPPW